MGDLPLFGRTVDYPVNLYYTVRSLPESVTVYEPETGGDTTCTLDGCPVRWTDGKLELKAEAGSASLRSGSLPNPAGTG